VLECWCIEGLSSFIFSVKLLIGGSWQIAVLWAKCCSSIREAIFCSWNHRRFLRNYALPFVDLATSTQKLSWILSFRLLSWNSSNKDWRVRITQSPITCMCTCRLKGRPQHSCSWPSAYCLLCTDCLFSSLQCPNCNASRWNCLWTSVSVRSHRSPRLPWIAVFGLWSWDRLHLSRHKHNPKRKQSEDIRMMILVTFWISLFQQDKEVERKSISTQQLNITRKNYIYY
jgi:hypothetical protein